MITIYESSQAGKRWRSAKRRASCREHGAAGHCLWVCGLMGWFALPQGRQICDSDDRMRRMAPASAAIVPRDTCLNRAPGTCRSTLICPPDIFPFDRGVGPAGATGALAPAMLKPRGRECLIAPAIFPTFLHAVPQTSTLCRYVAYIRLKRHTQLVLQVECYETN